MKNKPHWLDIAELIDSWRIFPRLVLIAYGWFVYEVSFFVLRWYASEPATARGPEETAMVGVVFTAVTGFAGYVFKIYADGGRTWGPPDNPPSNKPEDKP